MISGKIVSKIQMKNKWISSPFFLLKTTNQNIDRTVVLLGPPNLFFSTNEATVEEGSKPALGWWWCAPQGSHSLSSHHPPPPVFSWHRQGEGDSCISKTETSGRHPGRTLEAEDGERRERGGHQDPGYIPEKTVPERGKDILWACITETQPGSPLVTSHSCCAALQQTFTLRWFNSLSDDQPKCICQQRAWEALGGSWEGRALDPKSTAPHHTPDPCQLCHTG